VTGKITGVLQLDFPKVGIFQPEFSIRYVNFWTANILGRCKKQVPLCHDASGYNQQRLDPFLSRTCIMNVQHILLDVTA